MNKQILRLALPSIVANITIPLVGLVDMAIVGHLSDATAIGGIAIGTMLFDLLYWNFGFLRVGSSGQTAQSYGRNDDDEQINPYACEESFSEETRPILSEDRQGIDACGIDFVIFISECIRHAAFIDEA